MSIGPKDLLWNAKNDLVNQLQNDDACKAAAQQYLYTVLKVGGVLGLFKHAIVNESFTGYIRNTSHFYNGTTSTLDSMQADGSGRNPAETVSQHWFYQGSTATAATVTPSYPLQTFWQPADATKSPGHVGIDPTSYGMNLLNESTLLHEALHGYIGKDDRYIQEDLHTVDPTLIVGAPSDNISLYISEVGFERVPHI